VYLDRNARELILRCAYAGQPLCGKTRSIRALMPLLQGAAVADAILSPHEEQGRTLYFDWASYRGGSVQGNALRCQIVTVPGQAALAQRRKLLIESADVVVFVVDSDPQQLAEGRRSYQELLPWLRRDGGTAIPLVFQCNKRDLPAAAPLEHIRAALDLAPDHPLFESTATSGRGIRLAFIAALKAACAHAGELRALRQSGSATRVSSGAQLLELLERMEGGATPTPETPASLEHASLERASREPPLRNTTAPVAADPLPRAPDATRQVAPVRTPVRETEIPRSPMTARSADLFPGTPSRVPAVPAPVPQTEAPRDTAAIATHASPTRAQAAADPGAATSTPQRDAVPASTVTEASHSSAAPSKVAAPHASVHEAAPPPAQVANRAAAAPVPLRRADQRWSGQGPRPAVMPAEDWRAFVLANGQAAAAMPPALTPSVEPPAAPAPVTITAPQLVASDPAPPAAPTPSSVPPPTFESASTRPAVMPVAAWRAWLQTHHTGGEQGSSERSSSELGGNDQGSTSQRSHDSSAAPEPTRTGAERPSEPTERADFTLDELPPAPIHDDVDSVLLPQADQPLANVWPIATWQSLSSQFHRSPKPANCQDGIWSGEVAPGWLASSAALFGDRDTGLEALGLEVQRRERLRAYLWPHRCLVLCGDGAGYWRLWELVRIATTLDQTLKRILLQSAPGRAEQVAGHLVMLGRAYVKALDSQPQASEQFALDFNNVAQHEGRLVYAGSLHTPPQSSAQRREEALVALAVQLRLHLPVEIPPSVEVLEICRELQRTEPEDAHAPLAALFCRMLMRYADARPGRESSAGARH